jgi:hypothetical protein
VGRDKDFLIPHGLAVRRLNPRETVIRGYKEGSLMIDIVLAIALLLGSVQNGAPAGDAGGNPIPPASISAQ